MAKIAIITGSGSGIGRASALALLKNGYKVVLAGRRKEALEETAGMAGNNAPNALAVPTDVTSRESIQALFARTKQAFGRLDLIFKPNIHLQCQPFAARLINLLGSSKNSAGQAWMWVGRFGRNHNIGPVSSGFFTNS